LKDYPAPVKTEKSTPASAPDPVFIRNSDSGSCSDSGKNCRLRLESTPTPWSPLKLTHNYICFYNLVKATGLATKENNLKGGVAEERSRTTKLNCGRARHGRHVHIITSR